MANLTGTPQSFGQPLYQSKSTADVPLGTIAYTADGRMFRYARCGATATVAGKLYQTAAELTNHDNLAVSAASIGATRITVTLGNTAVTANQYAGGMLAVDTTAGVGYGYIISSHPAADASAACVFTIDPPGLIVALDTNSRVTLTPSPYADVIITPATTLTGAPVGVATYIIAATEYGWLQVKGPAAVLIQGTPGVGNAVVSPGSAAGAVTTDPANAATPIIGTMMVAGADGEYNQVLLNLP
jgi:hypothetical protein